MRELGVGEQLDQYELVELLARNGMASVYKAIDLESRGTCVVKVPYLQYEADVVFFERFRREEEIGLRLDHPNVVRFLAPREKSRMYLVMEYVEGKPLRAMLRPPHPLATDRALDIVRQLCSALAYLHRQGVVHRDIKPENVIVTASGRVKILDFGIALLEAARRLTWSGLSHAVGTPDYMAPEQISGRRGDARTDVYALGTMLYEMLTCNLPFAAPDSRALLRLKTSEEPTAPSYHVPGFDPSLEAIILRAIERSPRDRYAGAAELLADLENPSTVPPRVPGQGRTRQRGGVPFPRRIALPLIVVTILAGLGSLVWLSSRPPLPPARPPTAQRQR